MNNAITASCIDVIEQRVHEITLEIAKLRRSTVPPSTAPTVLKEYTPPIAMEVKPFKRSKRTQVKDVI